MYLFITKYMNDINEFIFMYLFITKYSTMLMNIIENVFIYHEIHQRY